MSDGDKDAIARAYAHMDEVNAAHSRGEETAAEKALRDAKEGKTDGSSIDPETPGKIHLGDVPKEKRSYRPKPSAAAKAFLARQAAEKRRQSVTILEASEAIDQWRRVQFGDGPSPSVKPEDVGDRTALRGHPIPVQVWLWVRSTPGFDRWKAGHMDDNRFGEEIQKWPLPMAFFEPLPPLCDAEMDELARGRREIEEQLDQEKSGDREGRLRPGMVRLD